MLLIEKRGVSRARSTGRPGQGLVEFKSKQRINVVLVESVALLRSVKEIVAYSGSLLLVFQRLRTSLGRECCCVNY